MLPEQLERLRAILARRVGLAFDDTRRAELADAAHRRMRERGRITVDAWLDELETNRDELRSLAQLLTVGETYFFRAREQLDVLEEVVLPNRPRSRGPDLNILSAGCSSGEEAYSLAIVMREWERQGRPASWVRWRVHGVDLNGASVARANAAVYSAWSLRATSHELRERWFVPHGGGFEVKGAVRENVTFEQRSLVGELNPLAPPETFDAIFCRNVIMYLAPDAARAVVEQLTKLLVPGGYLFLGHAESLRGVADEELVLESSHDTFYYRRPDLRADFVKPSAPMPTHPPAAEAARPREVVPQSTPTPSALLDDVRKLVAVEHFDRALDVLAKLAPEGEDARAEVLRAVAYLGIGDVDAAERCSVRLIASSDPPPEAHVVLAFIAESRGDRDKAIEHHRAAVYLDPDLALSHLHLGRIQRRAGRIAEARHELSQALELLPRESTARLVLFGGGFGRDGLLALCRSELASLGGPS